MSIHIPDGETISGGKQPASLQGDGMQRAIGQPVAMPIGSLKEQIPIRKDAIDPLSLLQGLAMFLEKNTLAVVADLLLNGGGVIEALSRWVRERSSRRQHLSDALPGRVVEATFVVFDLHAKQTALRVDEKVTFQKHSWFGGMRNDGVIETDTLCRRKGKRLVRRAVLLLRLLPSQRSFCSPIETRCRGPAGERRCS